jgi:hypothetical protein
MSCLREAFSRRVPLIVGFLLASFACADLAAVPVDLRISPATQSAGAHAGEPAALKARGTATWYGPGEQEAVRFEISMAEPARLDLAAGRWLLEVDAPGHWANPHQLELGEEPVSVELKLWAAGAVAGGVQTARGEPSPGALTVFFRPAPGSALAEKLPPGKTTCSVEDRSWTCRLPAGVLDLRFQVDSYVPRYRWGVHVPIGGTEKLGRFDLVRGSSVLGWVVTSDGSPLRSGARVSLRPRASGAVVDAGKKERLQGLVFEAPINDRGFFQIDGAPAGAYVLEARQEPFAPAVATVRVLPGRSTEVANPPLVLEPPRTLEVFIEPVADPAGEPWTVELLRLDRDSSVVATVANAPAGPEGSWNKAGLSPGRYLLQVRRSAGDRWHVEEVELDGSTLPLQVQLEGVAVQGVVRLGEAPLAAALSFGGRHGAVRVETRADEEGLFQTFLPQPGEWRVFVSSPEEGVARELSRVEIQPRPGKRLAELELLLPDNRVSGRVVDERGNEVELGYVTAQSVGERPEPKVQARVEERGRFQLRGLAPGPLALVAEAEGDRSSERLVVQVPEDGEVEDLVLVAREQVRISGVVVSSTGPVPGARVKAAPAGIRYLGVRTVTTDAQGRFEVSLPPAANEMLLAVAAPGFALRMLRLPIPEDRQLAVGVEPAAGTLVVESEEVPDRMQPGGPEIFVFRGNAFEGIPFLLGWAALHDPTTSSANRAVIPFLEPGEYQACFVLPAERPGLDFGIVPRQRCASGYLAPNGELTLKVPGKERSGEPASR